jgi:hypothetical protein
VSSENGKLKPIILADVRRPRESVALVPGGREYEVRPVNGVAMQMERRAVASGDPLAYYDLAAYLVPDAPRAEIDELDGEQLALLVAVATHGVAVVAAEIERRQTLAEPDEGNAAAPTPSALATSPASAPAPGTTSTSSV